MWNYIQKSGGLWDVQWCGCLSEGGVWIEELWTENVLHLKRNVNHFMENNGVFKVDQIFQTGQTPENIENVLYWKKQCLNAAFIYLTHESERYCLCLPGICISIFYFGVFDIGICVSAYNMQKIILWTCLGFNVYIYKEIWHICECKLRTNFMNVQLCNIR